jgi:hypothetical protein
MLFAGQTSQGTACNGSLNSSDICHARFFMAADRSRLIVSPRVHEVLSQHGCPSTGASFLFAARCGTSIIYDFSCSPQTVTNGHFEIHDRFPDTSFTDIVGDCNANNSCSGTYSTSTSNQTCVSSGLTWTATAVTGASAEESEDFVTALPAPETPLHEYSGLQVQVGDNGSVRIIEPAY